MVRLLINFDYVGVYLVVYYCLIALICVVKIKPSLCAAYQRLSCVTFIKSLL